MDGWIDGWALDASEKGEQTKEVNVYAEVSIKLALVHSHDDRPCIEEGGGSRDKQKD